MSCSLENLFVREFERKDDTTLIINQCEIGDVGCVVWDAAIVLASYLETADFKNLLKKSNLKNTRVVELGSGTGIVGLQAACIGGDVVITDLAEFVPLLQLNIDENKSLIQGSACAQTLVWGQSINKELTNPDLILLADCVYYEEAVTSLVTTITELAGPETVVLCCYEERDLGNKQELQRQFFEGIEKSFEVEEIPTERQDPIYSSEDIHIFKFTKKVK